MNSTPTPDTADSEKKAQPDGQPKASTTGKTPESASPPPASSPPRRLSILNRPPSTKPPRKGFFFHLEVVFLVAAILATLFTVWTPGRPSTLFLPASGTRIAKALQPSPTFLPGASTSTLSNPRLVGIVAGHWKNDSGAVCPDGLKEVDINLNVATLVQKILVDAGYQVDLLHEFDSRLTGYQAAALISIHNDSCDFINNEATGFKVAAAFATRHPDKAARLTSCLRARYGAATGLALHSTSVTSDMTSYHAFGEIDESTPASIIETGFLNLDRTILTQQPDKVAQGVAAGILCYLRNESIAPATPAATGAPAPTPTTSP
jgi:N-acetylmuramoyl-L-alanine amidase